MPAYPTSPNCGCDEPTDSRCPAPAPVRRACPSAYCDDRLSGLPTTDRGIAPAIVGNCWHRFPPGQKGQLTFDGSGQSFIKEAIPSDQGNGLVFMKDGEPQVVEPDPEKCPIETYFGFNEDGDPVVCDTTAPCFCGDMECYFEEPGAYLPVLVEGADGRLCMRKWRCGDGAAITDTLRSQQPGDLVWTGVAASKIADPWLFADGRAVSVDKYPELFDAIGYSYGGSGDMIRLPDGRGRFIRGADNGAGNDPDASSRSSLHAGGATGDNVGSYQGYAQVATCYDKMSVSSTDTTVRSVADGLSFSTMQSLNPDGHRWNSETDYWVVDMVEAEAETAQTYDCDCPPDDDCPTCEGQCKLNLREEVRPKNLSANLKIYAGCKCKVC